MFLDLRIYLLEKKIDNLIYKRNTAQYLGKTKKFEELNEKVDKTFYKFKLLLEKKKCRTEY